MRPGRARLAQGQMAVFKAMLALGVVRIIPNGGAALASDRCPAFCVMGAHEAVMSSVIRDPARGGCAVGSPPAQLGMRLVLGQKHPDAAKTP